MEPPKPDQNEKILKNSPQASPEDIQEYERLLAKRYTKEPSSSQGFAAAKDPDAERLAELTRKLFGPSR